MNNSKVKSTGARLIAYLGGCDQCDFSIDYRKDLGKARRKIRSHVAKTGHTVWVESTYANYYKPKETKNAKTED